MNGNYVLLVPILSEDKVLHKMLRFYNFHRWVNSEVHLDHSLDLLMAFLFQLISNCIEFVLKMTFLQMLSSISG